MSDKKNNQLLGAVARWARAKGIPKPATKAQWQALLAQWFAETGPAWHEIPDAAPTHLLENGVDTQIVDAMTPQQYADDDFAQEVDRRQQALAENEGDELRAEVALQAGARADMRTAAEPIGAAPASAVGQNLGRTVIANPPGGDEIEVAAWQGQDIEVQPVTCTIGQPGVLTAGTLGAGPSAIRSQAIVRFGTQASLQQAEVDVGRGTQFVVTGSQVRLGVKLLTTPGGGTDPKAQIYGQLAFWEARNTRPVTCTRYIDSLNNGANSGRLIIPAFAKTLVVNRSSTANSEEVFLLAMFDSTNTQIYNCTIAAGPMPEMWLPPDAVSFVITNTGADTQQFRAIFGLSFG